jgi:deoxyribonuclease IV
MNSTNTTTQNNLILGAHFSIAKGLHDALYQAKSYGCNALQMFTKNASTWKERTLTQTEQDLFEQARRDSCIHAIATHTSYLINLASPDAKKHAMSLAALKQELTRASALKIPFCVLHPGAHMDSGADTGLGKIARSLNHVISETKELTTRILLETTAGQGSGLGHTFEQIFEIIDKIDRKDRVGVCLDTCHIFAAGYDIRNLEAYQQTMNRFNTVLGLDQLFLIHINDSKKELGSRVDRHTHIGEGALGVEAFRHLINDERLMHVPKLLETAHTEGDMDWTQRNLDLLRSLV